MPGNTSVDPVKWIPASSRCARTCSEIFEALPLTMLITPGGRPASFRISMRKWLTSSVCVAGLNTTVLPMSAAAVGRLAPMDVKLKGCLLYTSDAADDLLCVDLGG